MGHETAELTRFLIHHGYSVIFFWVLAEQAGMPLPSVPLLLSAGALSAEGKISFHVLLFLTFSGAFLSDLMWFQLGRTQGSRILNLLCRISIEPDSCVRNTENLFIKRGASSLLVAKFLPGLNTVAQPMAGIVRLSWVGSSVTTCVEPCSGPAASCSPVESFIAKWRTSLLCCVARER